ncbi:MAG: hypothetical protein ACOVNL_13110 [Prochlorococcaceae cyanobacterium]
MRSPPRWKRLGRLLSPAVLLPAALALGLLQQQGLLSTGPSMVLSSFPVLQRRGALFSTHRDREARGCSWSYWYLQHSKKVWFRVPDTERNRTLQPVFSYRGQPILHVSEARRLERSPRYARRTPVLWGDYVGSGWGTGPQGTTLFLELWTRWTWLHPEACGHPEQFSVDLFDTPPGQPTDDPLAQATSSGEAQPRGHSSSSRFPPSLRG